MNHFELFSILKRNNNKISKRKNKNKKETEIKNKHLLSVFLEACRNHRSNSKRKNHSEAVSKKKQQ
jgi:hypothetical protein